jgi:MscS family membrane protein
MTRLSSRIFTMCRSPLARGTAGLLAALAAVGALYAQGDEAEQRRVEAFLKRPPAEKLAGPRQAIETLCFSVDALDQRPALIADAVACLDIDPREKLAPGTAELLAIQLEKILDELSLPFQTLIGGADGKPVVFHEEPGMHIALARGADGLWRFDRATVAGIPGMLRRMEERSKQRHKISAALREGMEDPTATLTTFLKFAVMGDFESAAQRLNLSAEPAQELVPRAYLAWKLACVMQRRGYLYREDVPIDPEGLPYTWSADAAGRITVARVPQPGGKDTWLFTPGTVAAIETMWQQEKDRLPDVRYAVLGQMVAPPPEQPPAAGLPGGSGARPELVPAAFASPRAMVRAFYRAVDEAEYDDAKQKEAWAFLDLGQLPPEDIPFIGPKRVEMLEAVLRKLRHDLADLSDHWSAPPQMLSGPGGLRVEIVRQQDNCWRFSADTVARLPAMYESIGGKDKTETERLYGLGNPRETLLTFFTAVNHREDDRAARCLDLSELAPSARANLGPVLAFKLKYVIDRIFRVYLQEVPNDPDGPRLVLYRGPIGRIVLARRDDEAGNKVWTFTSATVDQVERMFAQVLNLPADEQLAESAHIRLGPDLLHEPGIWLRVHLPAWLRQTHLGLEDYQWLAVLAALALAWLASWLVRWLVGHLLVGFFHLAQTDADRDLVRSKLRSLQTLAFFLVLYKLAEWLDLPAALAAHLYVVQKLILTVVLTWAALQWTDLGSLFYQRREQKKPQRGLGSLIVPFTTRMIKLGLILTAATYLVYQFGQGESLTRFLTGLGIAGLAVSLAAQDSLRNLFGTLLLIGDRTFRIGDRIVIGGQEGVVEQVGFRSTRLRTPEDSLLVLPNALLANGIIDNLGLRNYRHVCVPFFVAVNTPLDRLEKLRDAVRGFLTAHAGVDPERVHVHVKCFGKAGIDLEASAYFEAQDAEAEKQARELLVSEIVRQARALGVELTPAKA